MKATIIHACEDEALFARWFRDAETWRAWFVFLRALFGLPMSADDLALYRQCTGRDNPPKGGTREAWLVCGRRGGKSFVLALVAVFLACFHDWSRYLTPGERGTIMVLAADRRQARTIYRYAHALLVGVPMLKGLIVRESAENIDLRNGVTIEISAASFRTVRGYTLIAALCDEIAFWRSDESANPDTEILAALRPAMATIPGAMLLCASSPYARRGVLWKAFQRYFGKDDAPLVWKADTRTMNPTVPQSVIDAATEEDPASAAAEYGAEFRSDIETFVSREAVEACVVPGRRELPRVAGLSAVAFADPSGGSSDSMTLAIVYRDRDRAIVAMVGDSAPSLSARDSRRDTRPASRKSPSGPSGTSSERTPNVNNTALKAAPPRAKPPARSAERQNLADSIARREAASLALEAGKRAATRGLDAVEAAEPKVEAARAKIAEAGDQDASALADAVASGEPVTTMATRAALTKAEDAQHELAAATSAHAKPRARRKDLEDALRDAENRVTGHVYRVIRADAGQLLSEAQQAASRLRELLPVLLFMQAPNLMSPSTPRSPVYTEGFDDEAITAFVANPRSKRDDWYGPVAQWRAAREALMNDADAPLPSLPM